MTRALACFSVSHAGLRLRIRLLPNVRSVDREFRAACRPAALYEGLHVNAYFMSARRADARHAGTIALPAAGGQLLELVPHEVTHAVMHWIGGVHCTQDERLATAIGRLTVRILTKIHRLGYAL